MDKHTTKGLKYLSLSYIFKTMASQRYKNIYRIGSNLFKIYLRQTEIHFDKKNHDKSKNQKEISNEEWEKVIWRFTLHGHDVHQFSNNWGYDGLKENTWGISGYNGIKAPQISFKSNSLIYYSHNDDNMVYILPKN